MKQEILDKLKNIKLFLFDLEGVLYNKDYYSNEDSLKNFLSEIEIACNRFKSYNVCFGIVTARQHDKLIDDLNNIKNCTILATSIEKVSAVKELAEKLGLDFTNIFYMGDDILDIPLLRMCGLSASPKNSKRDVKRVVNFTIDSGNAGEIFNEIYSLLEKIRTSIPI